MAIGKVFFYFGEKFNYLDSMSNNIRSGHKSIDFEIHISINIFRILFGQMVFIKLPSLKRFQSIRGIFDGILLCVLVMLDCAGSVLRKVL